MGGKHQLENLKGKSLQPVSLWYQCWKLILSSEKPREESGASRSVVRPGGGGAGGQGGGQARVSSWPWPPHQHPEGKGTHKNRGGSSDLPMSLTLTDHFNEALYSPPPISEAELLTGSSAHSNPGQEAVGWFALDSEVIILNCLKWLEGECLRS